MKYFLPHICKVYSPITGLPSTKSLQITVIPLYKPSGGEKLSEHIKVSKWYAYLKRIKKWVNFKNVLNFIV